MSAFYGIPQGAWPTKNCEGDGCTNKISQNQRLCPACGQQEAAENLWQHEMFRREYAKLLLHLQFEAWCDEHGF